jgi:flagellar basal body-associated protein FliL
MSSVVIAIVLLLAGFLLGSLGILWFFILKEQREFARKQAALNQLLHPPCRVFRGDDFSGDQEQAP